jgi:hypothetical protein
MTIYDTHIHQFGDDLRNARSALLNLIAPILGAPAGSTSARAGDHKRHRQRAGRRRRARPAGLARHDARDDRRRPDHDRPDRSRWGASQKFGEVMRPFVVPAPRRREEAVSGTSN